MIPLRDENPSQTTAGVTVALIAVNVAAFVYELMLGPDLRDFMLQWGTVPDRFVQALSGGGESLVAAGLPLATSMFLHGGWLHLIGNMWYLWIFGDNVEDRMGHTLYLIFYLAAGFVSGLLHVFFNPTTRLPAVGASGAIAGVLGAYLVAFPRARVITLVPLFPFFQVIALPAVVVLGFWIVMQFFSGALALGYGSGGGVAWWAHVGGFAFGFVVMGALGGGRRRAPQGLDA